VNYRFIACGEVFADGLRHAAQEVGYAQSDAYWDDPELPGKVARFKPDVLLVVDGRRFTHKWADRFRDYNTAVWLVNEPYEVDDTARWSQRFRTVFLNDRRPSIATSTRMRYRSASIPWSIAKPDASAFHLVGFIGAPSPTRERFLQPLADQGLLSYLVGGPWASPGLQRLCRSTRMPAHQTAELYQRTRIVINVFRDRHHFNALGVPAHR